MLLALLVSSALGAEVDLAPSGAVVTVRPEAGETAAILDDTGVVIPLPEAAPSPMWLVHPEAWRLAVAQGAGEQIRDPLVDEQAQIITNLEADLAKEKGLRSGIRLSLEDCQATHETETKMLRRSRTHWTLGALGTGLLVGAAGVAVVAL
jgi:hypothetical protein